MQSYADYSYGCGGGFAVVRLGPILSDGRSSSFERNGQLITFAIQVSL